MTIDLAALSTATEATYDLELRHPVTEDLTGLFISHVSSSAPAVTAVTKRQANAMRLKEYKAQRGKGDAQPDLVEDSERRGAERLATATTAWFTMERDKNGNLDPKTRKEGFPFGGDRTLFGKEEAERLYTNPGYDWLVTQLVKSMDEAGNFIGK